MKIRHRLWGAVAAAALCGLLMTAPPAKAGPEDNSLNWVSRYPIDSLDPYYNTSREAIVIMGQLIWDTLIWRDPESGEYKPLARQVLGVGRRHHSRVPAARRREVA